MLFLAKEQGKTQDLIDFVVAPPANKKKEVKLLELTGPLSLTPQDSLLKWKPDPGTSEIIF